MSSEMNPVEEFFMQEMENKMQENAETESTVEIHAESKIRESEYLKKLSQIASYDSDLAIAKAQSAELVRQMDHYRTHYEEFEKITHTMIQENDKKMTTHLKQILKLAISIEENSDLLSENIDKEIQRLTAELQKSLEENVMVSCNQELAKVQEAIGVLENYCEKVKRQSKRLDRTEKFKTVLFIISSLTSPIVLICMLLSYFHVI